MNINEEKYKKQYIGKFKGCIRKIIKLGNKIGPIRNRIFSDRYTDYLKRKNDKSFKKLPLSQITTEIRYNEYHGEYREFIYGYGWKNPIPELKKRELNLLKNIPWKIRLLQLRENMKC